jgi:hypothetical protein
MSVSVNIMEASPDLAFVDQYRFDVARCEIAGILSQTATEALLAISANHGDGEARDLVAHFAARHPSPRLRFAALRELACAEADVDAGLAILARGRAVADRCVAELSAREMARIEANRAWIERDVQPSVR